MYRNRTMKTINSWYTGGAVCYNLQVAHAHGLASRAQWAPPNFPRFLQIIPNTRSTKYYCMCFQFSQENTARTRTNGGKKNIEIYKILISSIIFYSLLLQLTLEKLIYIFLTAGCYLYGRKLKEKFLGHDYWFLIVKK